MRFLSLLCGTVLLTAMSWGQTASGTITGTITDPSGAIVANAAIEALNKANGQTFSAVSTGTGNYALPQMPVGTYDLKVTVTGFKAYNRNGLTLSLAQTMRIDVALEVGAVSDSVVVTAEASLLNTESAELTHNVTIKQLNQLPILNPGGAGNVNTAGYRDPFALATLLPGIQFDGNNRMVVNGVPDDTIQIRVEGQTSGGLGGLRQYTTMGTPPSEAIQEVAVQSSNYSAEFGAVGGAVFNTTMKSGTNQYHGSIYDYAANEAINAATPYTGVRNPTKRHDYGVSFGGPIRIPKLYDGTNKTFFFGSLEVFRENVKVTLAGTSVPTVPTDAYRLGNFQQVISGSGVNGVARPLQVGGINYIDPLGRAINSGQIFDQLTEKTITCNTAPIGGLTPNCTNGALVSVRDAFAGNIIPASRFDPVSVKVLALVPRPLGPNAASGQLGGNYQNPWLGITRSKVPSLKLDQTLGSKGRLSGYYGSTDQEVQYSNPNGNMEGFPLPITGARGSFIYSWTYRANYDYTIAPTLLLHLGAGWYHQNFNDPSPVLDYNALTELGLKGSVLNRTFPIINVGSAGVGTGGMSNLGPFTQGTSKERRPSGVASLSWSKGNHNYKFGGEWRGERYPSIGYTASSGSYTFGSNSTQQTSLQAPLVVSQGTHGFALASFLMGDLTAVQISTPNAASVGRPQIGFYAQDSWKVTRKLTLDYGLRYDWGNYARERFGRAGSFNPLLPNASAGGHPGGYQYEATCNCKFAKSYPWALGPRLGFAYQLNAKTVMRGGIAVVYLPAQNASGTLGTNSAFTSVPGFGQTVGRFQDGIPSNLKPVFPDLNPNATQLPGTLVGMTYLDPNAARPARQFQYSYGIQREITKDLVVEASYIANRGSWWSTAGTSSNQLNVISVERLAQYGFAVGNTADSTLLTRQIGQLSTAEKSTLLARGVNLPYSNFPTNQTVRQSILSFPQYNSTITPSQAPVGKTWFDSLQLNVTQRTTHGLSFSGNYTYSKNLDLLSSPDLFNRSLGKALSSNDLPHQFRLSAQYEMPNFRSSGNKMLSNRLVSNVLSGWGFGILFQYQSAARLARPNSAGANPISNWLGRGPGSAQIKLDANGQPMSPWAVNWTDYNGVVHPEPLDVNCRCFDPTKTVVLNPNAWTNIPAASWANDFSNIRTFRGLRYPNEAANFSRNFRIKEGINLNVRVEFQNVTNRLRLPQPTIGNFSAIPTQANGLYNGGYGTIVPIAGTTGQRTGLFIGRLTF